METCKERSIEEQLRDKVRRGEPLTEEDRSKASAWHREHYAAEHRRYYGLLVVVGALFAIEYVLFGTAVFSFIICLQPSATYAADVGLVAIVGFIVLLGPALLAYKAYLKVYPTHRIYEPDH